MSITRATLRTRVKERASADLSTPVLNDLQDSALDSWANQGTAEVMKNLGNPNLHYRNLMVHQKALSIASGVAALEADYFQPLSLTVKSIYSDKSGASVTISERNVKILDDPMDFQRFDEANFLLKVDNKRPICFISDKIYFKQVAGISEGKFNYIKNHPLLSASQGTEFSALGDNLLILYIIKRYYKFLEMPDLVRQTDAEIAGILQSGAE